MQIRAWTPTAALVIMPEATPTMPKSTSDLLIDFAARWEIEGPRHYRYRIPSCQFLLVERGRLWARQDGRRISAGPGDLLCLTREIRNEYGWDAPVTYWEAHLTIPGGLHIEQRPPPGVLTLGIHLDAVRAIWETWCQELSQPGDAARFRVQAATYGFLAAIAAALGREPARPPADPWRRVRDRLGRDLGRPLALADVARLLDISPDHLIRSFRRAYGISPMAWRARATLRQAATMLTDGQAVKRVAHRLGFTDASAFTRAFRRQFGVTPTVFVAQGAPLVSAEAGAQSYPSNQHIQPPGAMSPWFGWG